MNHRRHETVRLPLSAGGALVGSLSYAEKVGPSAVLFAHGFTSVRQGRKADALEAECGRRGWTFASFDFRGHGESGGALADLSGSSLQTDLDQVYSQLGGRGVRRLFLVGASMGGFACAWFAARRPEATGAAVLVAPALRFLEARWLGLDDAGFARWRRGGRLRLGTDMELSYGLVEEAGQFAFDALAERWSAPLLIYHGLADEIIPYAESLEFLTQTTHRDVELRLVKEGDHTLEGRAREIAAAACDLFARSGFEP